MKKTLLILSSVVFILLIIQNCRQYSQPTMPATQTPTMSAAQQTAVAQTTQTAAYLQTAGPSAQATATAIAQATQTAVAQATQTAVAAWTPTPAPTSSSKLFVGAFIVDQLNNNAIADATYLAVLAIQTTPVVAATVSVTGPNGVTLLTNMGGGEYMYASNYFTATNPDYQAGATYTIKINNSGTQYSSSIFAPGGLTLSADGSTLSWPYAGNYGLIEMVCASGGPYVMVGPVPNPTSPVNINATSLYSSVTFSPATYDIDSYIYNIDNAPFDNSVAAGSSVTAIDMHMITYTH